MLNQLRKVFKIKSRKLLYMIVSVSIFTTALILNELITNRCISIFETILYISNIVFGLFGLISLVNVIDYVKTSDEERFLKEAQIKQLYQLTITDNLTGLYNRGFVFEKLNEFSCSLVHRGIPVSILMIDVDDFKKINDRKGHVYGDYMLKTVSNTIKNNVRKSDIVGRYGGEELICISPYTNITEAIKVAEHIRKAVQENTKGECTISIGISQIRNKEDAELSLVRADSLMYKSKAEGKNKTSFEI